MYLQNYELKQGLEVKRNGVTLSNSDLVFPGLSSFRVRHHSVLDPDDWKVPETEDVVVSLHQLIDINMSSNIDGHLSQLRKPGFESGPVAINITTDMRT